MGRDTRMCKEAHPSDRVTSPRLSQHFPRIENAIRVEGRLDGAHHFERHRVLDAPEKVYLELADAMLGRDRTTKAKDDFVDGLMQGIVILRHEGLGVRA